MKRLGFSILVVGLLAAVASPFVWAFWPSFEGWRETQSAISAIEAFDVALPMNSERTYGVNTFINECSSQSIKNYYIRAVDALTDKNPDVRTFHWVDQMGWDRVSTVLQTQTGFIEVRASCNNDNDSFLVAFTPGRFEKPDAKILDAADLPNGILRCDLNR